MQVKNIFSYKSIVILIFLLFFYYFLYKFYSQLSNSFGCFDECMNYLGGYFMLQGRSLFTQIFFNHQPLMGYLSLLIIKIFHPLTIFDLVLKHTQFIIAVSFVFNFIIIRRFKWAGLAFAIIFELTKYYLFANKFLGESLVVYPIVYMAGLVWLKLNKKHILSWEYLLSALFTWLVIFTREPFIPIVILEFLVLLEVPNTSVKKFSYAFFAIGTLTTILFLPIREYIFQVFILNFHSAATPEAKATSLLGFGSIYVLLYPLFLLFGGIWNEFRILLAGLSIVFCTLSLYLLFVKRQILKIVVLTILLAISNLRPVVPGHIFYASFHIIPWYGMFILFTFFLIIDCFKVNKLLSVMSIFIVSIAFLTNAFYPKTYIRTKPSNQVDFIINYGQAYALGSAVHLLSSNSKQTFFIDYIPNGIGVDTAYFQSGLNSAYKYGWYGSFEPGYSEFSDARSYMFFHNLPDFYYGIKPPINIYQRLYDNKKPTFLYVKKSIAVQIPESKWQEVKNWGFERNSN